jgi:hypothetical protein
VQIILKLLLRKFNFSQNYGQKNKFGSEYQTDYNKEPNNATQMRKSSNTNYNNKFNYSSSSYTQSTTDSMRTSYQEEEKGLEAKESKQIIKT